MWVESRRILVSVGDQKVTIAAFVGLLLYGVVMLFRHRRWTGRLRATFVLGIAALWLLVVMTGAIPGNLAQWSSLAVFLLAVSIEEGKTSPDPQQDVSEQRSAIAGRVKREPNQPPAQQQPDQYCSPSHPPCDIIGLNASN